MKVALVCIVVQCLLLLQVVNGEDYRENSPRAYNRDTDDEQQSDERSTSHYNRLPEGANTVEDPDYKNGLKQADEGEEGEGKFFHKLKRFFRRPRQRIIRRRRPYSSPCRPRYVNNRGQGKVLWDTTVLNVYPEGGHGHGFSGYGGFNGYGGSSGVGPHFHYHPFAGYTGYFPHHKPHKPFKPHRPQHYGNDDSNGDSGETSDYSSNSQNSGNNGQGNQNAPNGNNGNGGGGGYINNGNGGGGGYLNNGNGGGGGYVNNGGGGGGYLNNGNGGGGGGGYLNNPNGGGGGYLNNGGGGGGYLNNGGGGGGYLNNGGGGYLNNGGGGGGGGYLNNGGGGGGYTQYNDGINCDDAGGAFYEEIIYEQPHRPRPPNFGLGLLNLIRPPVVFYPGNINPAPSVVSSSSTSLNTPVLNTPVVTRPMTVTTTNIPGAIMQTNVDVFDPVYDNRPVTETVSFDVPQEVPGVVGGVANTVNTIIQTLTGNYRPGRRTTANRPVRYTNNRNRQRRF